MRPRATPNATRASPEQGAGYRPLAAAESVCAGGSIAEAQVLALLSQLVDKSLVAAEDHGQDTFYKCPETIREYGAEKLRESGEEAGVRQRHRDWYLALMEGVAPKLQGPEQGAWLQRLEHEHDNLRAALHWSRQPAEREVALRLVAGGSVPGPHRWPPAVPAGTATEI